MRRKYPWFATQNWEHILFLHWAFPKHDIEPFIPNSFELDTFNDKAWITIVIFRATQSRFRFTPSWINYPPVTQVNVRTYVKPRFNEQEKGVYFFSLNANSTIASIGATHFFRIPFNKNMTSFNLQHHPLSLEYNVHYDDETLLHVNCSNKTNKRKFINNNLTNFLTERYCIWNKKGTKIVKIPLTHAPWKLKEVEVQLYLDEQITDNFDKFIPSEIRKKCVKQDVLAFYCPFKHAKLHFYETVGFYR